MKVKPGRGIPMNRQYLEYLPEVGTLAANSHHGQQHHLKQQPESKAASPSNLHSTKTFSSWADHVGGSACPAPKPAETVSSSCESARIRTAADDYSLW